jgi:uncharacterized protein YjbJ (UPF0337 family)
MDSDRLVGTAHNLGGKVQEGAGNLAGDAKLHTEGLANQAAGAAQDLYGQAKDVASDAAAAAKSGAGEAGDFLRETIEQRPLTSALVAFGLGFVLASMRRRDY